MTAIQTEYYTLRGEIAATARQIDGLNKRLSMWTTLLPKMPFLCWDGEAPIVP